MSAPDLLQCLRAQDPDSPALSLLTGLHEEFRWTYRQLLEAACGFRAALQGLGAGPGSYVCLIADNSPQFIGLFLACLEAGCCFVPLHPDHNGLTITGILRELRPALVIVDEELPESLLQIVLSEARRTWRLRLTRRPSLRAVVTLAHRRQADCVKDAAVQIAEQPQPATVDQLPVLLLHSSGSTGAPKVILYTRARLNMFLHWQRRLFTAFPDDPADLLPSPRINALPLAHFGGLSFVLQALLDGRTVHLPRAIAPYDYLALATRESCHLLMLVPALYEALLRDAPAPPRNSSLRYCLTMGEAVTPQLVAIISDALDVRVYSAYGMSEGLSGLSHHGVDIPANSCGRHLFGELRLVADPEQAIRRGDSKGDTTAGSADEGELWVRNATTFPCYRAAELNAQKFIDGWYRTGDRFRRDLQGNHYFLGRIDAMCVVNGRNVYPAELEQVFLQHAEVSDCMAAVMALDKGRRRLGVLICLCPGSGLTPAALVDWFLVHGALHATPAWLVLGKGIPRNAAGKRDRLAVAALLQQDYQHCLRKVS